MKAHSEELAIFVAVVEGGSFSRAAERLSMANSAVSRAVKKLENKLGVELLTRTTRQIKLTQEGEAYFRRVQSILQEMAAAENELIESKNMPQGSLRIDAATPVVLHLLMPMIKPFRKRFPEVTLSLVSSETFINLIERKVDIAIRAGNLSDSSLRARPLFISRRKIVASPAYLSEYGVPERVEDLTHHPCLGFVEPLSLNRWPVAKADGQLYDITPECTSNSGETIRQLCLTGNGIACLSDFMIDKDLAEGKLVELMADKLLPVEMPFNAVYYSDRAVSTRIRSFIDFIGEWLAGQSQGKAIGQGK
ncbi:DNA-binding transcriptional regulator YafC [Pantoea sp. MBD-2R]|uniref:DNA-binding transcriptional regulator YafC n=1 Tax=unclassified Pantoea TaxID=2630326 RepID=UPI0011BDEEBF|nr:DNA-binding transcriptional regulator YafC [Pantoea sp. CCBC3-3-1]